MLNFSKSLKPLVQRRLARFVRQNALPSSNSFSQALQELVVIIEKNMRSGRYDRYRKRQNPARRITPARYVDTVIGYWFLDGLHWKNLKNRDEETWQDLKNWLTHYAKKSLGTKRVLRGHTAEDFAHQSIERILNADYPFDVPFVPWALTILHREIWGRARDNKDLLNHNPDSLDEWFVWDLETGEMEQQVADPLAEIFPLMLQNREILWNALKQLSEPLFDVIDLSFFVGLTDEEIARKLNTTMENIQTRRHRALARLHWLLTGKRMSGKRRQKR